MDNLKTISDFLAQYVHNRLSSYFNATEFVKPEKPILHDKASPIYRLEEALEPDVEEWLVFALGLVPQLSPGFMERILTKYLKADQDFPEFGGRKTPNVRYMQPTGDTALFLIAGTDIDVRLKYLYLFDPAHFFAKENLVVLEDTDPAESKTSGRILMDAEFIELFTRGFISPPKFSPGFPARYIETQLTWDDLVINQEIVAQLQEINNWITHHQTLHRDWNMGNKLRPGYMALFHGPPGTGKTLACSLMGKYTGRSVFRVDLSSIVSKYIGETEKNLSSLFQKAENKNWILFFDEADALFGKRTQVKSSNDRFANQEVSYLLQRIETFAGLVVLATNHKSNMDEAFLRRFNSIVEFAFPAERERIAIWRKSFPKNITFEGGIDVPALAGRYEIAGGNIINAVQYACLKSIERSVHEVRYADVELGIKRELEKEGRIFSRMRE